MTDQDRFMLSMTFGMTLGSLIGDFVVFLLKVFT